MMSTRQYEIRFNFERGTCCGSVASHRFPLNGKSDSLLSPAWLHIRFEVTEKKTPLQLKCDHKWQVGQSKASSLDTFVCLCSCQSPATSAPLWLSGQGSSSSASSSIHPILSGSAAFWRTSRISPFPATRNKCRRYPSSFLPSSKKTADRSSDCNNLRQSSCERNDFGAWTFLFSPLGNNWICGNIFCVGWPAVNWNIPQSWTIGDE